MLENENENPLVQSPAQTEVSIDDDNMDTVHFIENPVQLQSDVRMVRPHNIDVKKEHTSKDKKKEEFHFLEMPVDETPVTILLNNEFKTNTKSVPVAAMRSDKLTAMAANIKAQDNVNISTEMEDDIHTSTEMEDDVSDNDTSNLVKLENFLIVPKIIKEDNIQNTENKGNDSDNATNKMYSRFNQIDNERSILIRKTKNDEEQDRNRTPKSPQEEKDSCNEAGTSSSKHLSLSCVNSSGLSENSYREEMDNHVETMQTELENLRGILRGEGYSIDANTLLGLFGADDPMSFGLPVNPELNPHFDKEEEDDALIPDSINGSVGGELMAYNPTSNLLDFDDDIFLENASSSLVAPTSPELITSDLYSTLEDDETALFDSFATNTNSKS